MDGTLEEQSWELSEDEAWQTSSASSPYQPGSVHTLSPHHSPIPTVNSIHSNASTERHTSLPELTALSLTDAHPTPGLSNARSDVADDYSDSSSDSSGPGYSYSLSEPFDLTAGYISLADTEDTTANALPPAHRRNDSKSSSSAVLTNLKKRWKAVKKTGVKSTASAGKSLSSLSSSYFTASRSDARETCEERHSRLSDEWLNCILPAWRKKRKTTRVRTLVFRGVPANVRGRVWQCAIGNPLNITEDLFRVLKERAHAGRMEYLRGRDSLARADGDVGGDGGKAEAMLDHERSAHKAIMLDLPRTFPDLCFFHAEGSHYELALRDILETFLYLKPDVGYSQGMSFLAAVLLLYMDPYDAFKCFVNMLLHKSCFLNFFKIQMPEVRFYLSVHESLFAEELPTLHAHFRQQGIESDLYMINWVMSLYCRALPLDLVTRIWDVYVLDGDVAIFRAALGILKLFTSRLLKMKFEDIAYFLSHIPADEINADELLRCIRSVRVVTRKRFRDLFKECQAAYNKAESREASVVV